MTSATDMTVAQTILEQLGGRKFKVMTGAKNFLGDVNSLSFRLPGAGFTKDNINYVKITLNELDLYDVEFMRLRGRNITKCHIEGGIYADKLREVFTRHTGLDTSLGIPASEMQKFNNRHED